MMRMTPNTRCPLPIGFNERWVMIHVHSCGLRRVQRVHIVRLQVFGHCCQAGCLAAMVVARVAQASSSEIGFQGGGAVGRKYTHSPCSSGNHTLNVQYMYVKCTSPASTTLLKAVCSPTACVHACVGGRFATDFPRVTWDICRAGRLIWILLF